MKEMSRYVQLYTQQMVNHQECAFHNTKKGKMKLRRAFLHILHRTVLSSQVGISKKYICEALSWPSHHPNSKFPLNSI